MAKLLKKSTRRAIGRSWGYILLPITAWAWFIAQFSTPTIAVMLLLVIFFFMFQAPVPCCAATRQDEWCRNNGSGIFGGCHFKNHRWQNAKMLFQAELRQRAANGILRSISGKAATVSATVAALALLVNVGILLVNMSKV